MEIKRTGFLEPQVVLQADHIKPFAFAIDNGRTLCVACHKTTDTFGGKVNKKI